MPLPKRSKVLALAVALLLAVAGVAVWLQRSPVPPSAKPATPMVMALPVKTAVPRVLALADHVQAVGSFIAEESAMLSAEIGGRVRSIHFSEGQPVQAGALLIQLEPDEYRATSAQSHAQATLDKLSLGRIEEVRRRNLASQQSLDEAKGRWQQSQAVAQRDKLRLDKTAILAPFAGVVGLRQISPGAFVNPGQALVNLEALDTLKLDFALPEHYAGRVAAGQKMIAQVDAYPDEAFAGALYAVDPHLDEQSRSLKLRGRFANADRRLKPGMFARINLVLGTDRQALFVPEHALIGVGSRQYVYCVREDKAWLTEVVSGQHQDGLVEVVRGLDKGSAVVEEGQMKLRDGTRVRRLDISPQYGYGGSRSPRSMKGLPP